jgi:hypothetical protein
MKSLFKKHYERKKRSNAAAKHVAVTLEESKINLVAEKQSHEAGDIPSNGNNMSEDTIAQTLSLSTLNDSVDSHKHESSNILKQVHDCENYQQMQPNNAEAKRQEVSAESSSATAERRSGTRRSQSVSENNLSQTGSLRSLHESVNTQTRGSNNIMKCTGGYEKDDVQVIKNKTFSQAQLENEDLAHWKPRQDYMELNSGRALANVRHQINQNTSGAGSYVTMPKRVRIWDGE